jgi:hypothetical protein
LKSLVARDGHAACCRFRDRLLTQLVDDPHPSAHCEHGRVQLAFLDDLWRMVNGDGRWPVSTTARTLLLLISAYSFLGSVAQRPSTSTQVPPLQWLNLTSQLNSPAAPPPLKDASIGYDPVGKNIIIFGGESQQGFPQSQTYLCMPVHSYFQGLISLLLPGLNHRLRMVSPRNLLPGALQPEGKTSLPASK